MSIIVALNEIGMMPGALNAPRGRIPVPQGWFAAQFPYNKQFLEQWKQIPGTKWEADSKRWIIPAHALPALAMNGIQFRILSRAMRNMPTPLPALAQRLRPYQQEDVARMLNEPSFILAYEPRVGKTVVASVGIASALAYHTVRTAIILYPNQVVDEWKRQFPAFTNGCPFIAVRGTQPFDPAPYSIERMPYLAIGMHYELLRAAEKGEEGFKISPIVREVLNLVYRRGPYLAVADEPHLIVKRKSPRAEIFMKIGAEAEMRWCLDGTPLRSRPRDMFPIWEFLQAGSMGSYSRYTVRYCNTPEAPILMGDFTYKALCEIRVGDEVVGWKRAVKNSGASERIGRDTLCRTRVLEVFPRESIPVVKVTMESGRVIRCTPDHLWLDAEAKGSSAPALCDSKMTKRDAAIRTLYEKNVPLGLIEDLFDLTPQRTWTIATNHRAKTFFKPAQVGRYLVSVDDPTPVTIPVGLEYLAGWLGGMYDGEGHQVTISQSSVVNPVTWKRLDEALTLLNIPHTMIEDGPSSAGGATIRGGRAGFTRFLRLCKPVRDAGRDARLFMGRFKTPDRVVSIEPDGVSTVIGLKTETGNYVAWGYASKNCDGHAGDHGWVDKGTSNPDELKARLHSLWVKRTRREVAPWLPKTDRRIILCDLTKEQAKVYAAQETALGPEVLKAINDNQSQRSLSALRQLADSVSSAKMPMMLERVRHHVEDRKVKVLVFALHHETVQKAWATIDEARNSKDNPFQGNCYVAGGWLVPAKRKEAIDAWKADKRPAVLLVNSLSSGVGIDLSDADTAIGLETAWVPADFTQMEARIEDVHLGKRTSPPMLEYILARNTVDEDMVSKLILKLGYNEQVTGGDAVSRQIDDSLRNAGVVDRSKLSLAREDDETVSNALDEMLKRIGTAADLDSSAYDSGDNAEADAFEDDTDDSEGADEDGD